MHWADQYNLFLFDLDGLLVNTEELQYRAYMTMCQQRGHDLGLTFKQYFAIAQQDAEALRRYIIANFPDLQAQGPNWTTLYAEKKQAYIKLVHTEMTPLLPGAAELLLLLKEKNKKRCVVTHSQKELVDLLRHKNPILNTIPHWFTREDYEKPKPSPDGYLKAIQTLADSDDQVIGFEDTRRGLSALMQTRAKPVLVNEFDTPMREEFQKQGISAFSSLEEVLPLC